MKMVRSPKARQRSCLTPCSFLTSRAQTTASLYWTQEDGSHEPWQGSTVRRRRTW